MPKIFEFLGISIFFYSNEHEPIHVHGRHSGKESKAEIILRDGKIHKILIKEVPNKKPLSTKHLNSFNKLVNTHCEYIVKCWIDYFVYHKNFKCIKIKGKL